MSSPAADLARRLARNAEAVCRHYLSSGRREGRYWLVTPTEVGPIEVEDAPFLAV